MCVAVTNEKPEAKKEELEDLVSHILEEARMVLPGIQALLGFQLVAVFNQRFSDIPKTDQYLHLAAVFLSVNAICFLLTPAAIHRQSNPNGVTREFARIASRLICLGMMPLLLSIVLDAYVVFNVVLDSTYVSALCAAILLVELLYCWVALPQFRRKRHGLTPDC